MTIVLYPLALLLQATINVPADYPTIQEAVDNAVSGDTIVIQKGEPYAPFVITETDQLTIEGNNAKINAAAVGADGTCISSVGQVDDLVMHDLQLLNGSDQLSITGNGLQVEGFLFRNAGGNAIHVDGDGFGVTGSRFTGANGAAVLVAGDQARVVDNEIEYTAGPAISITGTQAGVVDNDITWVDGEGILIDGTGASVLSNRVSHAAGDGLRIENGAASIVTDNRMTIVSGDGINMSGDGSVIKNIVIDPGDMGIVLQNGATNSPVQDNRVLRALNGGIQLDSFPGTVTKNLIRDGGDGGDDTYGIAVLTDGASVLDNLVTDWGGTGIFIDGSSNTLQGNRVVKALVDGVNIEAGDGNSLIGNKVTGSFGEGLDNGGTSTLVDGNTWINSFSVDRANDAGEGATLVLQAPDTDDFETEGEPTVD